MPPSKRGVNGPIASTSLCRTWVTSSSSRAPVSGRASGTYKVDRKNKPPIEGKIVLGVVRDRGEPRIGLIAVTPNS